MENNIYDMDALYLYNDGWQYRVGKIQKVNEKSVKMDGAAKINKADFKDVHKLTEEEIAIFNKEMIKKLSHSISNIREMLVSIKHLKTSLGTSEFACINTDKFQKKLDFLDETLAEEIKPLEIGGKRFNFGQFNERLEEAKDESATLPEVTK